MRLVNKLHESEKLPRNFGIDSPLYPSEIHTIQAIGDYPDSNVRTVARNLGITPGAASQQISRLAKRGLIRKVRGKKNEKEVHLELTDPGRIVYDTHDIVHEKVYARIVSRIGLISDEEAAFLNRVLDAVESVYDERID
ncbi:MAG: MarR family winged helix-turn-helix transcriptional regulator, partial [Methanospirillum sp.]|nr:MarR family winged helix-turn-helix transcriptional regulator [Methanospirillum sp.]